VIFLALRHLLAKRRQSILVLLGISLGTMMFLVITGVQKGVQDMILSQLLTNTPHIRIQAHEERIDPSGMAERFYGPGPIVDWVVPPSGRRDDAHIEYPQGWFDRLEKDPRVLGFSGGIALNVIATKSGTQRPASVFGIIPERYVRMTEMEKYVKQGSLRDLEGGGSKMILGSGLMERLGTRTGETVLLSAGQGETIPFRVVGFLRLGIQEVDNSLIYVALQDAQRLNRSPGRIGIISVFLVDPTRAQEVADEWRGLARDKVESWEEASANFLQVFTVQKFSRFIITFAILVVAAFGTYNVLSILVNQKRREIAILRSIGYPPKEILHLFLSQGMILGSAGAVVGLLTGHLANLYIRSIDLGFDMGMGSQLPVSFDAENYLFGFALALVSAVAASYLPARAASKLTPLDIIRSET
jgi:lipoprotein-releasing system permease protein